MSENPEFGTHQELIRSLSFLNLENNFTLAALRNLIKEEITRINRRNTSYPRPLNHITVVFVYRNDLYISLLKTIKNWLDLRITSILLQTPPPSTYH